MNPEQLKDTTMNPDTRRLSRVRVRAGAFAETRDMFVMLMGKGEASSRRSWMEAKGNEVEADI
ncbi:DNA topoisomerase 4 subunit B [compost metagenome]